VSGANQDLGVQMRKHQVREFFIVKEMTKEDLLAATGLSPATIAKLGKDGNVTATVLARICEALNWGIADICEATPGIGASLE
jgi:putative transcriptional regulator